MECSTTEKRLAKTVRERVRKFREKKKQEAGYAEKESKRIESIRKRRVANMSESQKVAYRMAAAERKQSSRSRKSSSVSDSMNALPASQSPVETDITKTPVSSGSAHPYARPQSLGKAVRKSVRSLPYSPRKRRLVVAGLAKYVGLKIETNTEMQLSSNPGNQGLTAEALSTVSQFYFRSDVVYTAPGMRDEITVWKDGKKKKLRKYFLTMFLREAYAIFQSLHPDVVSFSKFCSLRPENVLLLKNSPVDQCRCRLHENFRLKLKSLIGDYDQSFWEKILCYPNDLHSDCWKGQCDNCSNGKKLTMPDDSDSTVSWLEWKKDSTERLTKMSESGLKSALYRLLLDDLPAFQEHVRIKRIQSAAFEHDKETCRVLQVDFAMAYSCEYQNEIQSALWARDSVTLFTGAVFCAGTCKTFLICSDTKDKGKNTVYVFLMHLFDIMSQFTSAAGDTKDVIFTDGPSSEFKNRYCMKLLRSISKKQQREVSWKYFATSHGKGVVDGIGGKAKSLVRQKVMSKDDSTTVNDSVSFAEVATQLMPSTKVVHISQKEIDEIIAKDNPWNDVPAVQGIHKIHVATCLHPDRILKLYRTAGDIYPIAEHILVPTDESSAVTPQPLESSVSSCVGQKLQLQVGDWCMVLYDGCEFPGTVTTVVEDDVEVSVMVPAGKNWKWPNKADKIFYRPDSILRKLPAPSPVGSRMQFQFKE